MMKPLLLAPIAFVGLASASPPPMTPGGSPEADGYPPCSATVTDRCVQTYERHRRHHRDEANGPPPPVEVSGGDYPPCTATRTDRCQQGVRQQGAAVRYARWERERVRIGERG
ncbi:MAG: hypothetical protein QOE79_2328 [Sphingomonadales bacterium]|jgi:hypothetical protein|nr:hypothetical protein [Sphingomonadales bacterium]